MRKTVQYFKAPKPKWEGLSVVCNLLNIRFYFSKLPNIIVVKYHTIKYLFQCVRKSKQEYTLRNVLNIQYDHNVSSRKVPEGQEKLSESELNISG